MNEVRREKLQQVLQKRQFDITVVMENVHDPHNISAVMRTCDAVGIQEMYILNTTIPPHKKFGAKSSSSAAKWLTIHHFTDTQDCIAALRKRYAKIYTTHLADNATQLYQLDLTGSCALVFGNEHAGVSDSIRNLADGNFIIPQVGIIQSLNISVACAVTIYEAFRQKTLAQHFTQPNPAFEQQRTFVADSWGLLSD